MTNQNRMILVAPLAALLLFAVVFVKTAWLQEDAWIYFRQVEQLFAGNGLVWNPHERMQLFTTTIGFFLLVAGRFFTQDYFLISAFLAVFFNALVLALLAVLLRDSRKWCAAVLLLTLSHAYMDYTFSGLFNYIGHAILIAFLLVWRGIWESRHGQGGGHSSAGLLALAALVGIAPLFRHDFSLIVLPPALYALWTLRGETTGRTKLWAAALILIPGALWALFSLFYFGQPFPHSAYFKAFTDLPQTTILSNGLLYYVYVAVNDFPTLLVVFTGLALLARGNRTDRALAAGMGLHLCYIVYAGGDYMGGRFFTYTYLLAVVALVANWERIAVKFPPRSDLSRSHLWRSPFPLAAVVVLWSLATWHTPLMVDFPYKGKGHLKGVRGVIDEKSGFHQASNIATYLAWRQGEIDNYPDNDWARIGLVLRRANAPVIHLCNMGMMPFFARLDQKLIDVHGYSDLLQSRLPALSKKPGHFARQLPKGYLDSVAADDELIEDPELNEYYRKIRLATQSDELFSMERMLAIAHINLTPMPLPDRPQYRKFSAKMPLVCDRERSIKHTLEYLDENIEKLDAATLNESDLSS